MSAPQSHVGVQAGNGFVARFGSAVVVVSPGGDGGDQTAFTNTLLSTLDSAGSSTPGPTPDQLAWRIAELVGTFRTTAPAFAVAVQIPDGQLVLLHGAARAVISGDGDDLELSGTTALTWVDHVVTGAVSRIALTLNDSGPVIADPRSDLRGGLVPGGGLVLTLSTSTSTSASAPAVSSAAAPEATPEATPEPAAPPSLTKSDDSEAATADDTALRSTEPWSAVDHPAGDAAAAGGASAALAAAAVAEPEPTMAMAALPDLDDDPLESAPSEPAPSEAAQPEPMPAEPTGGAEPAHETLAAPAAVGSLVADDGARTPLDRAYVFGREPQFDDAVVRGAASPVVVRDPDNLISRVQTYLWVDGYGVHVQDVKSANGTFVAAPGAPDWVRLGDDPAILPQGWSLRMGRRVFTYHAAGA